jgi:hypothetical protein
MPVEIDRSHPPFLLAQKPVLRNDVTYSFLGYTSLIKKKIVSIGLFRAIGNNLNS